MKQQTSGRIPGVVGATRTFHLRLLAACTVAFGHAASVGAEDLPWARLGGDTVLSWRVAGVEGALPQSTLHVDSMATLRVAGRLDVVGRSVGWRNRGDVWHARLVQLTARHEFTGPVGVRLEAGFLGQPVGLAAFQERATENPTVLPALSFDLGLPTFDAAPRLMLSAPTWPLGFQGSVSGAHWDARAAIVDSSPMRSRTPLAPNQPATATQFLTGVGVTPRAGLRIGGWWAHGPYAKAREISSANPRDRQATLGGLEAELAIKHSKVAAEVTIAQLDTTTGRARARGWTVEGTQTLTPRWFVAGRARTIEGPFRNLRAGALSPLTTRTLSTGEVTVGYRLSRELIVRSSVTTKQPYATPGWNHGVAASLVWAHRWF